jgi:hypothetical protein
VKSAEEEKKSEPQIARMGADGKEKKGHATAQRVRKRRRRKGNGWVTGLFRRNLPGAEVEGLDDAAAGEAVDAVEDVLELELHFLTEDGVGNLDEEDGATDDFEGATAVGGVLADEVLPVAGDGVLDFLLAELVALLEHLDDVAEGEGRALARAAAVLGDAAEVGDEVAGFAGEVHGGRKDFNHEGEEKDTKKENND